MSAILVVLRLICLSVISSEDGTTAQGGERKWEATWAETVGKAYHQLSVSLFRPFRLIIGTVLEWPETRRKDMEGESPLCDEKSF